MFFFFFKQKTAYEMRISDWSSDVCSSDLRASRIPSIRPDMMLPMMRPRRWSGARWAANGTSSCAPTEVKIGRASCRERVSVRVDLGGRRIIKKKRKQKIKNTKD